MVSFFLGFSWFLVWLIANSGLWICFVLWRVCWLVACGLVGVRFEYCDVLCGVLVFWFSVVLRCSWWVGCGWLPRWFWAFG